MAFEKTIRANVYELVENAFKADPFWNGNVYGEMLFEPPAADRVPAVYLPLGIERPNFLTAGEMRSDWRVDPIIVVMSEDHVEHAKSEAIDHAVEALVALYNDADFNAIATAIYVESINPRLTTLHSYGINSIIVPPFGAAVFDVRVEFDYQALF